MFSTKIPWLRTVDKKCTLFMQLHTNITVVTSKSLSEVKHYSRNLQSMKFGANPKHASCFSRFRRAFHSQNAKHTSFSDEKDQSTAQLINSECGNSDINTSTLLETWFYEVSPYGSLTAQLPFNTMIQPLNPQHYPDMNKCVIEFHYNLDNQENDTEAKFPSAHQLAQVAELYTLNVSFDQDKANMNLNCDVIEGLNPPISCYIQVPLKFDLAVQMEGNESITVESMEGDSINIETNKGDINLKKNKSGSVSVLTKSGNITSKSTQLGSIIMTCGNAGSITTDKLQGSNVTCSTELGSLNLKSLYTENATFKTVTGDVHLGHCHGQICVVGEKSNVYIESLDGDLDVALQQGSVKVHLSRHKKVDVDLNTGDIGLSFPEGTKTNLNLSGSTISAGESLSVQFDDSDSSYLKEGYIGEDGVAQVNARTMSGNIDLSMLDWIQTTKLAFMSTEE